MQPTNIKSSAENSELELATRKPPSTFRRVGSYAVFRLLTISITIIVGIFIAVVVANKGGGIDTSTAASLRVIAQRQVWNMDANLTYEERRAVEDEIFAELADEAGLNEPFLKKHFLWTVNALKLNLGDAIYMRQRATYVLPQQRDEIKSIIFDRLPNTLALVGLADLLVFVVGIPLALYLSRNYGNSIDKLINIIAFITA